MPTCFRDPGDWRSNEFKETHFSLLWIGLTWGDEVHVASAIVE